MNNKKAIVIHLDKCEEFRQLTNTIQCLNTIYYLQKIRNIDIVIHSVNNASSSMSNLSLDNLVKIEDDSAKTIQGGPYFTRMYSFICEQIQRYDEVIMYDNDFKVLDFDRLQHYIDMDIPEPYASSGGLYNNKDNQKCVWFGLLKVKMLNLKHQLTKNLIDGVIQKHNSNKYKNYEENMFVRVLDELGLQCLDIGFADKGEYRCLTHYGWSPSLHLKIENTLNIISNHQFLNWICEHGLYESYTKLKDRFLKILMERYVNLFKQTNEGKY